MTREQAIKLVESKWWVGKSSREICTFQLFEPRLCMPFDKFQEAVEHALNRSVWTHEFASSNIENLHKEFLRDKPAPTIQEIFNLIPEAKRIVVLIDAEADHER